jgi:hypothetical protein
VVAELGWSSDDLNHAQLEAGTIEVTPFRRQFLDICVHPREC